MAQTVLQHRGRQLADINPSQGFLHAVLEDRQSRACIERMLGCLHFIPLQLTEHFFVTVPLAVRAGAGLCAWSDSFGGGLCKRCADDADFARVRGGY